MVPSPSFLWTQIHLPYLPFKDFNSVTFIISASWEEWQAGRWGQCPKIRAVLRQTIESFPDFWAAGSLEGALHFFLLILMKKGPFCLSFQSACLLLTGRASAEPSGFQLRLMIPLVTTGLQNVGEQEAWRGWDCLCQLPSLPSLLHNLGPETRTELWFNGSNCWPSGVSDF